MFGTLDPPDLFFLVAGAVFLGLTMLPLICGLRLLSVPTLYVAADAALAALPGSIPLLDPLRGEAARLMIEHGTELIVIVALAGAGLAVDRPAGLRSWQHAWGLLAIAMPLTIGGVTLLGVWLAGLPLPAALLLAASLAPTDPVLARAVQVGGPNEGGEDDMRVALTTEAGLNDGLAFPFVHLAVTLAGLAAAGTGLAPGGWLGSFVAFDLVYRVAVGVGAGWAAGHLVARLVHGPWGDARRDGGNAGLVLVAATFLTYGATEALDGYGFLAVFVAARAGRAYARGTANDAYASKPHLFSDQVEKILLALLLLWLGTAAASGLLAGLRWQEVALTLLLVFVVRPLAGLLALAPTRGTLAERGAIAFLGIRGLGTFYYVAYAAGHAAFLGLDAVWRVAALTVLVSILVHGALAPLAMRRIRGGAREDGPGEAAVAEAG